LTDDHTSSTPDQDCASAESFNDVEGNWCGTDIDQGSDKVDQERIADRSKFLEEGCSKVEDKVDTSPLLHHLERSTKDGATQVAAALPETAFEAIRPAAEIATLGHDLQLVFVIGDDLSKLLLNELGVRWLSTDSRQGVGSFLDVATLDEVTR
jgi:hypothetical protein